MNKVTYGSNHISLLCDSMLSNVPNFCFYLFCCNQKEKDHIRRKINSKNKNMHEISIIILIYWKLGFRFLSKHFCLQLCFPKDSVSLLFVYFTITVSYPNGGHWRKIFRNLGLEIARKSISDTLSDCRSITCKSLINMIFFFEYQLRIPPFCHVCLYFLSAAAAF